MALSLHFWLRLASTLMTLQLCPTDLNLTNLADDLRQSFLTVVALTLQLFFHRR